MKTSYQTEKSFKNGYSNIAELLQSVIDNRGATVTLDLKKDIKTGYAVAHGEDYSYMISVLYHALRTLKSESLNLMALNTILNAIESVKHQGVHVNNAINGIGFWVEDFEIFQKVHIEKSAIFRSLEKALLFAKKHNQRYIYNLDTKKLIKVEEATQC